MMKMTIILMLLCGNVLCSTIKCWGADPAQIITCVISTSTNKYHIGDEILVSIDLKNVGTNEVQVAMPESLQGKVGAFLIFGPTAKPLPIPSHIAVQTNGAYVTLSPMQGSCFQVLVNTGVKQMPSLVGGQYGLQIEFSYIASPVFTGGRAHFASDMPATLEAYRKTGVPIIEQEKLWKGSVQSNTIGMTLIADR